MEIWKDIKNYKGIYQVSNLGRIRSLKRTIRGNNNPYIKNGRVLKTWNFNGYLCANLCLNGANNKVKVHRIVAEAFIENPENKKEVNHINGIRTDNRVENLEWCSHKENIQHAFRTGLRKTGTNATNSKLSAKDIKFILENIQLRSHKFGARAMGRKFNVSYSTILQILNCRTYMQEFQKLQTKFANLKSLSETKNKEK